MFANNFCQTTLAIPHLRNFLAIFHVLCILSCLLKRQNHRSHVRHKLLEVMGMIQQQFSSNEIKNVMLPLFVRYKFRHIEQDNTTLRTHFSNLQLVHVWHLLVTQQNSAVLSLYGTNCSGAPSVVWNSHFIFVHLIELNVAKLKFIDTYCNRTRIVAKQVPPFYRELTWWLSHELYYNSKQMVHHT